VHIVVPPIALRGPAITIRRFRQDPFSVEDLVRLGTLNARAVSFLRACILVRKNIVISGGTGSGKTTLLNTLGSLIPANERIVVIEDSAELQLPQPNLVGLEARRANIEGEGEISIKDLVRASLRMRPDRIVVGECRGKEALDMLQAMNTGHDGSLTTGHANSPEEMISRLEVMVLEGGDSLPVPAIHRQIAGAVDLIVQIQRQRDRVRRVTHVTEVVGYDADEGRIVLEDVFRLYESARPDEPPELRFTGYLPSFIEKLVAHDTSLEELF
jgi:pilus assembly protein CpaF